MPTAELPLAWSLRPYGACLRHQPESYSTGPGVCSKPARRGSMLRVLVRPDAAGRRSACLVAASWFVDRHPVVHRPALAGLPRRGGTRRHGRARASMGDARYAMLASGSIETFGDRAVAWAVSRYRGDVAVPNQIGAVSRATVAGTVIVCGLCAARIGIAYSAGAVQPADELLQMADDALYKARATGRDTCHSTPLRSAGTTTHAR